MKKLNLGCGRDIRKGYINIDRANLEGVDVKHDLSKFPWPFKDNYFDEVLSMGVIELLDDFLKVMEEIWRICKNGAIVKIRSPVFPNMCSAQDPLTKKFMTYNTFEYFKSRGFDYYSKARFRTLKREFIFNTKRWKWVSKIINIHPKFYARFLFNLFPANMIDYELEVVKKN